MRTLFLLLVFANLVFFAWTRGYLGSVESGREPQRLNAQLNATKLHIVATSLPVIPDSCRAVANLRQADTQRLMPVLNQQLQGATVNLQRPAAIAELWDVIISGLANRAAVDTKLAELKKLEVSNASVISDAKGGTFSLQLASEQKKAAAEERLQGLVKKGVKSAKLVQRPTPDDYRIQVTGPAAAITRLPELTREFANATLTDCIAN